MGVATALTSNPDRAELEHLIRSLVPPPNYRVVLDVHRDTEMLQLRVLRANPYVLKLGRLTLWRYTPDWNDTNLVQRTITSRTYRGMLTQLHENPEFLEFEIASNASFHYREAVPLTL